MKNLNDLNNLRNKILEQSGFYDFDKDDSAIIEPNIIHFEYNSNEFICKTCGIKGIKAIDSYSKSSPNCKSCHRLVRKSNYFNNLQIFSRNQ